MSSLTSSAVSLVKTIVGAGLLSMPLAFSTDGYVVGVLIVLLAAATSGYGLFIQAYVSRYVAKGHATFFNLCSITYPSLSVIFDVAIAIQCFGCAISYLVLIGDLMPSVFPGKSSTFWILVSAVVCVPLSFLKNLDSLKYTSILGLAAIGYLFVLVVGHFVVGDVPDTLKGNISPIPPSGPGVFSTFSIIVFAYTGHQNMFSIINEALDKSLVSLLKLVNIAIAISTGLFILLGLAGYLTFGDAVTGNVILLYPLSWTATLGRLAIVFMVVFSFPLMIHPARISFNNIYFWLSTKISPPPEEPAESTELLEFQTEHKLVVPLPNKVFNILTIIMLAVGYYLAVTVTSFALILAVVGATGSTAISFILPGLFGYKLIGSESDDPTQLESIFRWLSLVLVYWGFAVMFVCLYVSLL